MEEQEIEQQTEETQSTGGFAGDDTQEQNSESSEQQTSEDSEQVTEEPDDGVDEVDLFRNKYHSEKKKRKYIYAERKKLERENEELKQYLGNAAHSHTNLKIENLKKDLDQAKNIKSLALDEGDKTTFLEAEDIHQRILYDLKELEKSLPDENDEYHKEDDDLDNSDQPFSQEQIENAEEWIADRQELVRGSSTYNPKLEKGVTEFINALEENLIREGQQDRILSESYFDVIDTYLDSLKVKKREKRYTSSNVGAVRNNFSANGKKTVRLSEKERELASSMGMTEADWISRKYK